MTKIKEYILESVLGSVENYPKILKGFKNYSHDKDSKGFIAQGQTISIKDLEKALKKDKYFLTKVSDTFSGKVYSYSRSGTAYAEDMLDVTMDDSGKFVKLVQQSIKKTFD